MRIGRLVDLSMPIGPGTPVYPGDPRPRLAAHRTIERDGYHLTAVAMGSQTGTHVDAPRHFRADGAAIDAVDPRLLLGPLVLADATGLPPRGRITWDRLAPVASRLGPGALLALRTDWGADRRTQRRPGTAPDGPAAQPVSYDHPFLDAGACRRVLDHGVRALLLDVPSIDETPDEEHPGEGFPCHHLVAAAGGVVVENLVGLGRVDWPDPWVSCLPIALQGADGAPCRAVALQLLPG